MLFGRLLPRRMFGQPAEGHLFVLGCVLGPPAATAVGIPNYVVGPCFIFRVSIPVGRSFQAALLGTIHLHADALSGMNLAFALAYFWRSE